MIFDRAFSGDVRTENSKEHEITPEEIIGKLIEKLDSFDNGMLAAQKTLEDTGATVQNVLEASVKGEVDPENAASRINELNNRIKVMQDVVASLSADAERVWALITRMKEIKGDRDDKLLEVAPERSN